MRRLALFALTACWLALPGFAQHHASGGFAAHSSASSHSSFSAPHFSGSRPSAPMRSAGPTHFAPPRYGAPAPSRIAPNLRPGAPGNGWHRGVSGDRHRRPYISPYRAVYAYPYYVTPWIGAGYGPGFYDDSDSDYGNSQAAANPNPDNGDSSDQGNYADQGPYPNQDVNPGSGPGYGPQGPQPWPSLGPYAPRQPYNNAPEPAEPSAAPSAEQPITLVFKDGRPSMQIRNYILTPSMLYTGDGMRREIPLSDLDLAATADANRDSGIDFRLPQGQSH